LLGRGGIAAALLLLPAPAYAFDAATVVLPPALVLIAAVGAAVVALQRMTRRLARVEGERARLAEAYADSAALLKGAPADAKADKELNEILAAARGPAPRYEDTDERNDNH